MIIILYHLIASRIPPGRIDWVVGGRVVFFVLVVFSVFYVFVGLVAVLGCLLVVWLLGCWFEQPNNPKKQPPNNPMIRQPSYQTTQEHNNPTTQTNRFLTKKSKRQTTKNIRKSSQGDPNWSQNWPKVEPKSKKVRWTAQSGYQMAPKTPLLRIRRRFWAIFGYPLGAQNC